MTTSKIPWAGAAHWSVGHDQGQPAGFWHYYDARGIGDEITIHDRRRNDPIEVPAEVLQMIGPQRGCCGRRYFVPQ